MKLLTMERLEQSKEWEQARAPSAPLLQSFGLFYDAHFDDVFAYFYRRTFDRQASGDLTAESFAEALRCAERYDAARGSEREWLFGIARHQLSHYLRREKVHDRAMRKLGVTSAAVDDELVERVESLIYSQEIVPALQAGLDDLSDALRDAVILRIVENLSFEDVAERLGCSVGTARVRVSRGLTRLHDLLAAYG